MYECTAVCTTNYEDNREKRAKSGKCFDEGILRHEVTKNSPK